MSHFLVLRLLSNILPYDLQRRNHTTTIFLAWEKDSLVFVNVYTGKECNKAIHNGLTLPLVLTWYCHGRVKTQRWRLKSFRE